eukprot:365018-Chlamydomonas_euryale.AAC.6
MLAKRRRPWVCRASQRGQRCECGCMHVCLCGEDSPRLALHGLGGHTIKVWACMRALGCTALGCWPTMACMCVCVGTVRTRVLWGSLSWAAFGEFVLAAQANAVKVWAFVLNDQGQVLVHLQAPAIQLS